jgi:citrate lyase subunit alpha/citrate CoA-transferase
MVDAQHAQKTVVVTNDLAPYPAYRSRSSRAGSTTSSSSTKSATRADRVRHARNAQSRLACASRALRPMAALAALQDGLVQGGAGGVAAATMYLAEAMEKAKIVGGFVMGGGTRIMVDMLHKGLVRTILDGQAFDPIAVASLGKDPAHVIITRHVRERRFAGLCDVHARRRVPRRDRG